jgi:hypothetical protein
VGAEVAEAAVVVAACHCAAALPLVGEAEGVAVVVDVQPTRCPSKVRLLSVTVTRVRTSRSRRPNPSRRMMRRVQSYNSTLQDIVHVLVTSSNSWFFIGRTYNVGTSLLQY